MTKGRMKSCTCPAREVRCGFLDLNFHHLAGMLDDLGDESDLTTTNLTHDTFDQVDDGTIDPELPEESSTVAEGWAVRLDHTEGTVHRPEDEEGDEEMMGGSKALVVALTGSLHGGPDHDGQDREHDISRPSGAGDEVGLEKALETEMVLDRQLGKVVPMRDGVHNSEDDDRPGHHCGKISASISPDDQ